MARNRHPEETVNLILNVSLRLFMEKGYDHTSIQDIIDHLGGLSKGAIYHHFKSKEEILDAVTERITAESNRALAEIRDRPGLTGLEKLRALFKESLLRPVQEELFSMSPDLSANPRMLYGSLRHCVEDAAPHYVLPILRQGMEDGSIQTECPAELAELILLAVNVWINPMFFRSTAEESFRKIAVFAEMMKGLGLDIVDDEMRARLQALTALYMEKQTPDSTPSA